MATDKADCPLYITKSDISQSFTTGLVYPLSGKLIQLIVNNNIRVNITFIFYNDHAQTSNSRNGVMVQRGKQLRL